MRAELHPAMIVLLAGLALAGCQDKKQAPVQGTAGGEVLPGSTSDAMLPIDSVRSQPPLAPKVESNGAKPGKAGASGKPGSTKPEPESETEAEAPAAQAPAAEPGAV